MRETFSNQRITNLTTNAGERSARCARLIVPRQKKRIELDLFTKKIFVLPLRIIKNQYHMLYDSVGVATVLESLLCLQY